MMLSIYCSCKDLKTLKWIVVVGRNRCRNAGDENSLGLTLRQQRFLEFQIQDGVRATTLRTLYFTGCTVSLDFA